MSHTLSIGLLTSQWHIRDISETKKSIKSQLDEIYKKSGKKGRLEEIVQGIRKYENSSSSKEMLKLYIYIVSALVHQTKYGGFNKPQIKKLVDLAYSILQIQGIQPQTSKLGVLYGELHLAISQVYRTFGEHWEALWEQQISDQLSKKSPVGGLDFQSMSKGFRALRLGQAYRAINLLNEVDLNNLATRQANLVQLSIIKAFRLSGQNEKAQTAIETFQNGLDRHVFNADLRQELDWEVFCLKASQESDLSSMVRSVKINGSHYQAAYIAEAFLWSHSVSKRKWLGTISKMQTIARKKDLRPRDLGFFLTAVLEFEKCQDSVIPFVIRLKNLGGILGQTNKFVSIDRELLFYVAATRWLAKNHSHDLAEATLCEYQGLSLKLSNGKSQDTLNIASDLMERNWFRG